MPITQRAITAMRRIMTTLKRTVLALTLIAIASAAHAQRGHIGDGGRMPETMFPGAQPPTSMPEPRMSTPVERYPNTESLSQDRIESQGYRVDGMTQQNDGSWRADASRNAVRRGPKACRARSRSSPTAGMLEEREVEADFDPAESSTCPLWQFSAAKVTGGKPIMAARGRDSRADAIPRDELNRVPLHAHICERTDSSTASYGRRLAARRAFFACTACQVPDVVRNRSGDADDVRSAHFDDRTSLNQSMRPSYQHGIRSNFRAMERPFLSGLSSHRPGHGKNHKRAGICEPTRSERQRSRPC